MGERRQRRDLSQESNEGRSGTIRNETRTAFLRRKEDHVQDTTRKGLCPFHTPQHYKGMNNLFTALHRSLRLPPRTRRLEMRARHTDTTQHQGVSASAMLFLFRHNVTHFTSSNQITSPLAYLANHYIFHPTPRSRSAALVLFP